MPYTPQDTGPAKALIRAQEEIARLLKEKAGLRQEISAYLNPATTGQVCDELVDIARESQIKIGGKVLVDPAAIEILVSILKERHGISRNMPENSIPFKTRTLP